MRGRHIAALVVIAVAVLPSLALAQNGAAGKTYEIIPLKYINPALVAQLLGGVVIYDLGAAAGAPVGQPGFGGPTYGTPGAGYGFTGPTYSTGGPYFGPFGAGARRYTPYGTDPYVDRGQVGYRRGYR